MRKPPAPHDYAGWVNALGVDRLRREAKAHLMAAGAPAVPAVRAGLGHAKAIVRQQCVGILDHLVDDESIPHLVAMLDDSDPEVVRRALHALACDRCKQNECRPSDDLFVPRAIDMARHERNPDIRAGAIDTLGQVARRRPDIADVLLEVAEHDPHPGLRGMARQRAKRALARQ